MKKLILVGIAVFSLNAYGDVNTWIFNLSQYLTTCRVYIGREDYKNAKEYCGWAAEYAKKLIPYQSEIFASSVKRDMIIALRLSCKLGNKQDCGY